MTPPGANPTPAEDPTRALYITGWPELYEVNAKGGRWEKGQVMRARPLPFVRLYTYGPDGDNMTYAEAAEVAAEYGEDAWPIAWGLYCKLLEIAGRQKRGLRGFVLGNHRSRSSRKMLQRITCFTEAQIELGLTILSDPRIGWIQEAEIPPAPGTPETPDSLQERKDESEDKEEQESEPEDQAEPEAQTERATPDGKPGPATDQGNNGTAKDLKASVSGSEKRPSGNDLPEITTAEGIRVRLKLNTSAPPGTPLRKQMRADASTLHSIARHVQAGDLGEPTEAQGRCFDKASEIGNSATVRNPMSVFVGWVKKELAAKGHNWAEQSERLDPLRALAGMRGSAMAGAGRRGRKFRDGDSLTA